MYPHRHPHIPAALSAMLPTIIILCNALPHIQVIAILAAILSPMKLDERLLLDNSPFYFNIQGPFEMDPSCLSQPIFSLALTYAFN